MASWEVNERYAERAYIYEGGPASLIPSQVTQRIPGHPTGEFESLVGSSMIIYGFTVDRRAMQSRKRKKASKSLYLETMEEGQEERQRDLTNY